MTAGVRVRASHVYATIASGPRTMHVGCSDTETNPCPVVTTRKL